MVIEAVAIDGPAAAGKSTVGRKVADRLGFGFLDTGLMYRAATWVAIRKGVNLGDPDELSRVIESMRVSLVESNDGDRLTIDGEDVTEHLRTSKVDRNVSAVSAVRGVRNALVTQQRSIAEQRPTVMVGRDIGTVVLKDARTKVYLDAAARVRADRRHAEMVEAGIAIERHDVLREVLDRDTTDSQRADSPLRVAGDAVVIQTDDLNLAEVVDLVVEVVERR